MAVLAPMPSASDAIATMVNAALVRSRRSAKRTSRARRSNQPIVFMSWISSRMRVRLPSLRRAASRASPGRQATRDVVGRFDLQVQLRSRHVRDPIARGGSGHAWAPG